jgi:hypothetical protein
VAAGAVQGVGLRRLGSPITTLGHTAEQDVVLVAQPLDGEPQFATQFGQIVTADVAEFDVLEIAPDAFMAPNLLHVVSFKRDSIAGITVRLRPRAFPQPKCYRRRYGSLI